MPTTTTDFKDYYATLGVNKTATFEEIKQAYRKLEHSKRGKRFRLVD